MRLALAFLVAPALLASTQVGAQIASGLRAPVDVAMAVRHGLQLGCYNGAAGRPIAGVNGDFALAGPGLHQASEIPPDMKPLVGAHTKVAVLDAPGGAAWIFFDRRTHRCAVVPSPADAGGIDKVASDYFAASGDWRPDGNKPGAYDLKGPGEPRLRGWYQPATGTAPQMIIMEPNK